MKSYSGRWWGFIFLFGVILLPSTEGLGGSRGRRNHEDDLYPENQDLLEAREVPKRKGSTSNNNNNNDNRNFPPRIPLDETDCPLEFQRKCHCKYETSTLYPNDHRTEYLLVNCTNTGFTNASMLKFLPYKTGKLIFTGNHVPILDQNVFGKTDYPDLQYIDMSNNHIEEIKGKAFHRVSTVTLLKLSNNNISNQSIHDHSRVFSNFENLQALFLDNAFNDEIWSLTDLAGIFAESNLTRLKKLHLESNEMEIIQNPKLFCDLLSLEELYLRNNHFSDLNMDVDCLRNLSHINLAHNQIKTIRPTYALYQLLDKVNGRGEQLILDLSNNPFNCDCELQDFIGWVKNISLHATDRLRNREKMICSDGLPHRNIGMHLVDVSHTLCQVLQISNLSQVTTTLVWILSILVILLVFMLLYYQRRAVARSVQPLLQTAVHGVKYTSIDKQEEQAEVAHV